ncbi:MAG: DUF4278 domain-containing protein [Cyanobacteria bacterium P01_C01_bin.118]
MLTYRGVSYKYQPTSLATRFTGDVGKYRGHVVQFKVVDNPPSVYPFEAKLVYRGVTYTVGQTTAKATAKTSPVTAAETAPVQFPPIKVWMRSLVMKHLRNIRRREHSMLVRAAEDVGLPMEDAAEYESHIQGKVPHDFASYDRSPSAMS